MTSLTNTLTVSKPAKVSGAGRKSTFIAFEMPGINGAIVAKFLELHKSGIKVVTNDEEAENITLEHTQSVWAVTPKQAEQWKLATAEGEIMDLEFVDAAEAIKAKLDAKSEEVEFDSNDVDADEEMEDEDEDGVRLYPKDENYMTITKANGKTSKVSNRDDVKDLFADVDDDLSIWAQIVMSEAEEHGVAEAGSGKKAWTLSVNAIAAKYGHLNRGMQRMNCGNLVRGIRAKAQKAAKAAAK